MPKRKNVTWRVGDHPKHQILNNWIDAQNNIQSSLANVVLHMIERFGNQDIMDYDVQKSLYQGTPSKKEVESTRNDNISTQSERNHTKSNNDKDNIYKSVDVKNL